MAEPVTWALIATAVATAAVGTASAVVTKNSSEANAETQAKAAEYEASVLDEKATIARDQSAAGQAQQQRQARQILSAQRTAQLQSALALTGSAEDVYQQSAHMAALDKLNIAYEGELQARGLAQQAEGSRFNSEIARMNKGIAGQQFGINVTSSLLSGATLAYQGYAARKAGGY